MGQEGATTREQHPIASVVLLVLGLAIAFGGLHYGWGSLDGYSMNAYTAARVAHS